MLSIVRLAFTCLGVCRVEDGPVLHPASTEEELLVTYAMHTVLGYNQSDYLDKMEPPRPDMDAK